MVGAKDSGWWCRSLDIITLAQPPNRVSLSHRSETLLILCLLNQLQREAEVTESSTSQLASLRHSNVLLLSCRNEFFEFLLLTFSKHSPLISSVCVLQQSGHWEAFRLVRSSLYLLHTVLVSDCLLKGSRLAGKRKQLKALAKRYPWSPGCFICAAHNIYNGETRIASFFLSSVWGKQENRLHVVIGLNSLSSPF